MKVVILAGGYGTRISEESHLRPKPMIEIGGRPILWHIMRHYLSHGFDEFIICCGYKGYMIKAYFADYYLHNSDMTFDFKNGGHLQVHKNVAEPWTVTLVHTGKQTQTGGRIKRLKAYLKDAPFLITYGDGVSDVDIGAVVAQHQASQALVTLSAVQPGGRFGVLDIQAGMVTAFQEKPEDEGGWINGGFMVAQPELLDYISGDSTQLEVGPLQQLSQEGKLGVYKHHGFWQCMDTQRDKQSLEHQWESGKAKWKTW